MSRVQAFRENPKRSEALRVPPSPEVRSRMQATPRRDTPAELRIRRILHAQGFRYSIDARPIRDSRRRADILFRKAKVAVFIDGCFWHGCPRHGTWPKANADFWRSKIMANRARDSDTNRELGRHGWLVRRFWEHEEPDRAAAKIARCVKLRRNASKGQS
jgi:DNA mismatch endonuclease (patch repair protein)